MGLFKSLANSGRLKELRTEWERLNINYHDKEKVFRKQVKQVDIEVEYDRIRTRDHLQKIRDELSVRYTHLSGIVGVGSNRYFANTEELDQFHTDLQTQLSWFESWQAQMKKVEAEIIQLQG